MENVVIWYLADNEKGNAMAKAISSVGLPVNILSDFSLEKLNIDENIINIFIFDFVKIKFNEIATKLSQNNKLVTAQKFIILEKSKIKEINKQSVNIFNIEYISRPLIKNEFLLLLEKTIIVERYREIMKYISKEADLRIGLFEEVMEINRKNTLEVDNTKKVFSNIVEYEKNLMKEQNKVSKAIEKFTMLRQQELFECKSRINAEEILSEFQRQEMINAKKTIDAQESIISYSGQELKETKNILEASEVVRELSRSEAMTMHKEMKKLKEQNSFFLEKIDQLTEENKQLKAKI